MAKSIMIIDDERGVCDILSRLFSDEGYEVSHSTNPLEGIELVKKGKPDCVLLDIKMPHMDGIDVLAKLKGFDKDLKVIMITGFGNLETAMESMKLGAADYITKPFDLEVIKRLVKKVIEA